MNWTRLADRLSISSRSNIRSADPILKSNIQSINRITVSGLNIPSANRIIISRSNMWCADQFIVSRPNIWSADWITISRSNIRYRDTNSICRLNIRARYQTQFAEQVNKERFRKNKNTFEEHTLQTHHVYSTFETTWIRPWNTRGVFVGHLYVPQNTSFQSVFKGSFKHLPWQVLSHSSWLLAVNYFRKRFHRGCLTGS